jgi:polyisoprenoid-binding protein YceI
MKMSRLALFLVLNALVAPAAQAVEFTQVQADQSRITFGYSQMGVGMEGGFKTFNGQVHFDPAQPASAQAVIEVDLASIDTGTPEADEEVATKTWFHTLAFPTARFASTSVKAVGDNRYEVAGHLTIKGQTREILVPVTFTAQGNAGVFAGSLTLRRGGFAIGEGPWSAFDIVANEVDVGFQLAVTPGH